MNKRDHKTLKKLLTDRLAELLRQADCNLQGLKEPEDVQPDLFDLASHNAEREYSYQLCSRNNRHIREIEESLKNMEEGVYGVCERCGDDIGIKRLKVRPVARHCIGCKTAIEKIQRHLGSPGA